MHSFRNVLESDRIHVVDGASLGDVAAVGAALPAPLAAVLGPVAIDAFSAQAAAWGGASIFDAPSPRTNLRVIDQRSAGPWAPPSHPAARLDLSVLVAGGARAAVEETLTSIGGYQRRTI